MTELAIASNPASAVAKRAFGRSLSDFRLPGATTPNGLLPTEEQLLECAAQGKGLRVSELDWKRPGDLEKLQGDERFRMRASFLRFLALGGDYVAPIHEKGVEVERAYIEGDLDFEVCDPVTQLNLTDSYFDGLLILLDAHLKGLHLKGSRVLGIHGDRIRVDGSVLLRDGFVADGVVRLLGARIQGNLDCTGGKFRNAGDNALILDSAKIDGTVFLRRGFMAKGSVQLRSAEIGGNLVCDDGIFEAPGDDALQCDRLKVEGGLIMREFKAQGRVSLAGAHAESLIDHVDLDGTSQYQLVLDGFSYERLLYGAPTEAKKRIAWLSLQEPKYLSTDFRPQPFEQLARALRALGHDGDAQEIAMFKQRLMIPVRVGRAPGLAKPLVWTFWQLYRIACGFGYRPSRLVVIMLGLWLLGGWFYNQAGDAGIFAPADAHVWLERDLAKKCQGKWTTCGATLELARFQPLTYSADVVLPVVDLGQRTAWVPIRQQFELAIPSTRHQWLRVRIPSWLPPWLMAIQNFLGHLSALLFGAIVTGIIKKD